MFQPMTYFPPVSLSYLNPSKSEGKKLECWMQMLSNKAALFYSGTVKSLRRKAETVAILAYLNNTLSPKE